MLVESPPLRGVYLAHFGVKGMKWGRRKSSFSNSSSSSSKKNEPKMTNAKKFAIGTAVLGGAAVAAIILSRRGQIPAVRIGKANLKQTTMNRLREANKMKLDNFNKIKPTLGKTQYFDSARGTWATPTGSALAIRGNIPRPRNKVDMGNIADVRRAWNDPNHVWEL